MNKINDILVDKQNMFSFLLMIYSIFVIRLVYLKLQGLTLKHNLSIQINFFSSF